MSQNPAFCETLGRDCPTRALCLDQEDNLRTQIAAAENPTAIPVGTLFGAVFSRQPVLSSEGLDAAKNNLAIVEAILALECNRDCLEREALEVRAPEFVRQD